MAQTLSDIIQKIEGIVPAHYAETWDNTGLQIGKKNWRVRTIWVALDPLPQVVAAACENDVDLLITHHPLIFRPLYRLDLDTPAGSILKMAMIHQLAVYSAHTNFDSMPGGSNDILATRIGLKDLEILGDANDDGIGGLGRVGKLEKQTTLLSFSQHVKATLGLNIIKVAGKPDLTIDRVALCIGSGSSLMNDFLSSGAQVYVSGDLHYHDARTAEVENLGLIDIGHFQSEHLILEDMAIQIRSVLSEIDDSISVDVCDLEKDPFILL